jgi:hypothetical protein
MSRVENLATNGNATCLSIYSLLSEERGSPRGKADHSTPSSSSYTSIHPISLNGLVFIKAQGQIYLHLICETWSSHGDEDSNRGLLDCDRM